MDMRKLVGKNVRRVRTKKGLTQEQFADRSGFSQQYISDLERGLRNPTVVTLFELAQALGTTPVQLLKPRVASGWAVGFHKLIARPESAKSGHSWTIGWRQSSQPTGCRNAELGAAKRSVLCDKKKLVTLLRFGLLGVFYES